MIYPEKKKYVKDSKVFNLIPVFKKIRADFETPVSIFMKVNGKFLLESVERGENVGRYSMIALGKKSVIEIKKKNIVIREYDGEKTVKEERLDLDNPLLKIKEYFNTFKASEYEELPPFYGGAIGYLGYETVQYFEEISVKENGGTIPDGLLVIPEILLVYDSVKRSVLIVVSTVPGTEPEKNYKSAVEKIEKISEALLKPLAYKEGSKGAEEDRTVHQNMSKETFLKLVEKSRDYILNGEIIQVVISQQFSLKTSSSPLELYRTLRIVNPSPYMYFLDFGHFCIIGSSPEVMVKVQNREILLKPIAGTKRRGDSIAEDDAITKELIEDSKERAEHLMLVDLGRNDLGRIAVPGSVEVTDFMTVEKYSHVMHIVSSIKAELDEKFDIFDVIKATFPAGTLAGAPKVRAMEIIAELEEGRRGPYGGMIFYLGFNGNLDSCITIRTIILQDGLATIHAGAGIVADSIPENEYTETLNKAQALISTIQETKRGV
jgi:anthranilate synthase component 1